nr:hypothetical protein BaRGS_027456 [Batillaria attramentaria]
MFNGFVLWYPPIDMVTSCEMKISKYPFDTQQCYIIFTGGTNLQYYSPNGEWDFLDSWTDVGYFTDGTQYFKRLYFYFSYRRKWQFYGQNLVLPIVLTSILMCAVFALPIESGEKMGFSPHRPPVLRRLPHLGHGQPAAYIH